MHSDDKFLQRNENQKRCPFGTSGVARWCWPSSHELCIVLDGVSKETAIVPFLICFLPTQVFCLQVSNYTQSKRKTFSSDSFVCMCTKSYCDGFDNQEMKPLADNNFAVNTSSKDGSRFELNIGQISPHSNENEDGVLFHIDESQEITGFGAAFTGIKRIEREPSV